MIDRERMPRPRTGASDTATGVADTLVRRGVASGPPRGSSAGSWPMPSVRHHPRRGGRRRDWGQPRGRRATRSRGACPHEPGIAAELRGAAGIDAALASADVIGGTRRSGSRPRSPRPGATRRREGLTGRRPPVCRLARPSRRPPAGPPPRAEPPPFRAARRLPRARAPPPAQISVVEQTVTCGPGAGRGSAPGRGSRGTSRRPGRAGARSSAGTSRDVAAEGDDLRGAAERTGSTICPVHSVSSSSFPLDTVARTWTRISARISWRSSWPLVSIVQASVEGAPTQIGIGLISTVPRATSVANPPPRRARTRRRRRHRPEGGRSAGGRGRARRSTSRHRSAGRA